MTQAKMATRLVAWTKKDFVLHNRPIVTKPATEHPMGDGI